MARAMGWAKDPPWETTVCVPVVGSMRKIAPRPPAAPASVTRMSPGLIVTCANAGDEHSATTRMLTNVFNFSLTSVLPPMFSYSCLAFPASAAVLVDGTQQGCNHFRIAPDSDRD